MPFSRALSLNGRKPCGYLAGSGSHVPVFSHSVLRGPTLGYHVLFESEPASRQRMSGLMPASRYACTLGHVASEPPT